MVKKENAAEFSLPDSWARGPQSSLDIPPGFPPQSLKTYTSAAAAAAVAGISRNFYQNPTCTENGAIRQVHGKNQTLPPPPYRTCMKRSRLWDAPSTPRQPAAILNRSGWPQKSGFTSGLVINNNQVYPIQSTRPQEQKSSLISSPEITKEQSSLQVDEAAKPAPDSVVGLKTYIRKNTGNVSIRRYSFHARDNLLTEVPGRTSFYERARSVGRSEDIDPKILGHVTDALQYMDGSNQTAVDDAEIISRSSDFNKSPVRILKAINKKHGDITRDCSLESDRMKALV